MRNRHRLLKRQLLRIRPVGELLRPQGRYPAGTLCHNGGGHARTLRKAPKYGRPRKHAGTHPDGQERLRPEDRDRGTGELLCPPLYGRRPHEGSAHVGTHAASLHRVAPRRMDARHRQRQLRTRCRHSAQILCARNAAEIQTPSQCSR